MAAMDLFAVQLVALIVLFCGTFICGLLPVLGSRYFHDADFHGPRGKISSFVIYMGGGVMMSTSLLFMLPNGNEKFGIAHDHEDHEIVFENVTEVEVNASAHEPHSHSFAMPEFIFLCGFMGTYLIEVFANYMMHLKRDSDAPEAEPKFCSCAKRNMECSRIYKDLHLERSAQTARQEFKRKRSSTWAGQSNSQMSKILDKAAESPPDLLRSSIIAQPYPSYGAVATDGEGLQTLMEGCITVVKRPVIDVVSAVPGMPEIVVETHSEPYHCSMSVSSLLTVLTISCHALLEGFSIGSQLLTIAETWTFLIKVALHKFLLCFVVSLIALADDSGVVLVMVSVVFFAIMSPLGMALTMFWIDSPLGIPDSVVGAMDCVTGGTLLYVTFFQVWPRRRYHGVQNRLRCVALAVGAGLMAVLQYGASVI